MKKQIIFHAFIFLQLTVLILSCKKDDALNVTSNSGDLNTSTTKPEIDDVVNSREFELGTMNYSDCPYQLGLITKSNGRLVFQSDEHFDRCALCLEHQYDVHNDAFDAMYPGATAEQLDNYAALTNFNEWGSYVNFESNLSFSSLRQKILNESNNFLALVTGDDLSLDPDVTCPVARTSERALLNYNGEAVVNGGIKGFDDWTEKIFGDCAAFKIKDIEFTEADHPALTDRKLKVWIAVRSRSYGSFLWGKMKYYKKNSDGEWRSNVRADMQIRVTGNGFNLSCDDSGLFWSNWDGWKKRTHLAVTDMYWGHHLQAFVDSDDAEWNTARSMTHAYLFTGNNYFPHALRD